MRATDALLPGPEKAKVTSMASHQPTKEEEGGALLTRFERARNFAIFFILGFGPNWVIPSALFQQVPWLMRSQPEGLCLATYMNASVNVGVLSVVLYSVLMRRFVHHDGDGDGDGAIPLSMIIPAILAVSCFNAFLAAGVYSITVSHISILLFLCCAIGGSVGSMSSVCMNPFLMKYKGDLISASRSGGSGLIMLCALVAAVQQPGSSSELFNTSSYLSIFGCFLALPIISYVYISRYPEQLLREQQEVKKEEVQDHKLTMTTKEMSAAENAAAKDEEEALSPDRSSHAMINPLLVGSSEPSSILSLPKSNLEVDQGASAPPASSSSSYSSASFFSFSPPFRSIVLPYACSVGWINFNTWGLLSSLVPFAIHNASSTVGNGPLMLSFAYEISAVFMMFGDLSTVYFKIPFFTSLTVFTILAFTG